MTASTSPPILGIDLGTTMSVAAVYRDATLTFIENALGDTLTPSVVAYDARSKGLVVGRTAKEILALHPSLGAACFKRDMGQDTRVSVAGREHTPVELSAYVLDAVRGDAERQLGTRVDRCVVTVPAYFSEAQRHATKQAAELVGFNVERILNEPTAAAMAHGLHRHQGEEQFVVLDLGGGTFDVCVMELFEGLLEVKGVAGISQLGGEDFSMALRDLALRKAGVQASELAEQDLGALLKRAELLKRRLGRWESSEIRVPRPGTDAAVDIPIRAEEAEAAYRPLLDRMVAPCRSALRGAGVRPEDLSEVILVGGATRMPCIAALARELFKVEPRVQEDPDHLVAKGAALQAALCAEDASVMEMVVTDVASHSLGIDITREIDGRLYDGYFSPILERNTVIPTSRSEDFRSLHHNQTKMTVGVFEGEGRKIADNRKLGEIEVKGIPKGPPRAVIRVRFTYDLNGILEVEVTVLDTGETFSRLFQRGPVELDRAQLEKAKADMHRLKADPKERPRHRDLLARAAGLWPEVVGVERGQLEACLDEFEISLEKGDTPAIETSYHQLLQLCQELDQGERW